jgi:predicted kinase
MDGPPRPGRLIIVGGLPAAGKTTLARRLERDRSAVRLCPDEWMAELGLDLFDDAARKRVEALQWEIAQRLLELGQTVVIEWGTWSRADRDALRTRARELGVAVELRFLDAPVDVLWARVQARERGRPDASRRLTFGELEGFAEKVERPGADELALFD